MTALADDMVRAIVAEIIADDAVWWPTLTAGQVVGMLGADQAARFAARCEQLTPGVGLSYHLDGTITIVEVAA